MALGTHSKFYYGHIVDENNFAINFKEATDELNAAIVEGSYSLTEYALAVENAMNEVGGQVYSVTVDRSTKKITISSTGNFQLLFSTGSQAGSSARTLLGFGAVDLTGTNTYTSSNGSGSEYKTQFPLQDFVQPGDSVGLIDATINKSANGQIEVIRFGIESFIEFSLKYITDNSVGCTGFWRTNTNGITDVRAFLNYLITKAKFEFMPDEDDPESFITCILEKTPENQNGIAFKLKEQVSKNMPNIFETGVLTCRILGVS